MSTTACGRVHSCLYARSAVYPNSSLIGNVSMVGTTLANRYEIVNKLGEGWISVVYLAHDKKEKDRPVAVKILKSGSISQRIEDIIRFRSEAQTVSTFTHPNIIKFYELGECDQSYYIVMEYFTGQSLLDLIEKKLINSAEQAIKIIIQLCNALDYIHNRGVVHRDLKPGNILVSQKDTTVEYDAIKIIDFGLAQIKDFGQLDQVPELVGSFHYLAPEQTGLTRIMVDERSDLYSLGIILYLLLTKHLPFTSHRIAGLIHQHIAKSPPLPRSLNPNISPLLERVILKLLEKVPEDRYQSAQGLLRDLEKIQEGNTDFEPGFDDKSFRLRYRTRLIGRDQELNLCKSLLDRTMKGEGGVCLVKGEPGIGKSRLAEELKDYAYKKGATYIAGKCFVGLQKIPYGPFKELLDDYIRNFMHYTKAEKEVIREELAESLGELGEVIVTLDPQMERIIGTPPPLVPLEPDRESRRFITVASQFFKTLGRLEGGVILSIDDLQCMDESSFELLEHIAQDISENHLLILGTYRDNEITPEHALITLKENAVSRGLPIVEIALKQFDYKSIERFMSGLLYAKKESITTISDFVLRKSRGNPFFALEIVKQLINEKALCYRENRWEIEPDMLNKVEIFSTIVDTLLKRISLLDETEVKLLSFAAVIGRKFDINLLFELSSEIREPAQLDRRKVVEIIEKAEQLQLLEEDSRERGKILFVHDRITEAFSRKIGEEKKRRLHSKIGLVLESLYRENTQKIVFDLAYHFIEGNDREKSLKYAFPAGLKAKKSFANEEAVKYLTLTRRLLEECGKKNSDQWVRCTQALGEVNLIIGKYNQAISMYEQILQHVHGKTQRAKLLMQLSQAHFKKWDYYNCELYAKQGFTLLDEPFPVKRNRVIIELIKELLVHLLQEAFLKFLYRFKKRKHVEKYRLITWFYYSLGWTYVFVDLIKFTRTILRALNLSVSRIGPSKELGMFSSAYAAVIMSIPLFKRAEIYLNRSLKITRESNATWEFGQALGILGYHYQWKGEFRKGIDFLNQSLALMKRIGDIKEGSFIMMNIRNCHWYLGEYEHALHFNHIFGELAKKADDVFGVIDSYICYGALYHDLGEYEKAEAWISKAKDIGADERFNMANFEKTTYLGLVFLERGEIQKALEHLGTAYKIYEENIFLPQYTVYIYAYIADAFIRKLESERENRDLSSHGSLLVRIKRECRLALRKTKKWITHRGGALRVSAKYNSLIEKNRRAEKQFLESIRVCESLGRKYERALGHYEYGNFLNKIKRKEHAVLNWQTARSLFRESGANIWVKKIESILGVHENDLFPVQRFLKDLKDKRMTARLIQLCKEITSSSDPDKLLQKLLDDLLEITGAQRVYLLLKQGERNELELLASKSVGQKEPSLEEFSITVAQEVVESGEAVITANALTDEKYSHSQSIVQYAIKSILCFPIRYQNRVKGVCYLDNMLSTLDFTKDSSIEMLNMIISQALLAHENSMLQKNGRKAVVDEKHVCELCEEYDLTRREKDILFLLLKGLTNKEISRKSYVSLNTVRSHLYGIYRKTQARSREELIQLFTR